MTTQLYGICHNSPVWTIDRLRGPCKKRGVDLSVLEMDTKEIPKKGIVLCPNYRILVKFASRLQDRRLIVLVFDTPLQLMEVEGLELLDMEKVTGTSYLFRPEALPKERLLKVVKQATTKLYKLEFDTKQFDILPKLIEMVQDGHFLHHYNSFIYRSTNTITRNSARITILRFLFGHHHMDQLVKELNVLTKRSPQGRIYAQKVIDYLTGNDGAKLVAACTVVQAKVQAGKPVQYKPIAKKHGVDGYELRYLGKIWRSSKAEARFTPSPLDQMGSRPSEDHVSTGG